MFSRQPRSRCDYCVEVMADNGERAAGHSFFETGKLKEGWRGKWITPGEGITDENIQGGYIQEKTFEAKAAEVLDYGKDAAEYACKI